MKINLINDFVIALNAKVMYLIITDTFSAPDGTPMANVAIDIYSEERFLLDEIHVFDSEGNDLGLKKVLGEKVGIGSPYHLQRVVDVPGVPFQLVCSVINASVDQSIIPGINYAIDQAGFNALFSGSMEGFKLEIKEVIL